MEDQVWTRTEEWADTPNRAATLSRDTRSKGDTVDRDLSRDTTPLPLKYVVPLYH